MQDLYVKRYSILVEGIG